MLPPHVGIVLPLLPLISKALTRQRQEAVEEMLCADLEPETEERLVRLNQQYRQYATETLRPKKPVPRLTFLAIPILLTGCVTPERWDAVYSNQAAPTAAERSAVIEYARKTYYNERQISDATISNALTLSGGDRIICIRFKSKNQLTERAGVTTQSLHYFQGYRFALSLTHEDYRCNAKRLRYSSFAELERLF